MNRMNNLTLLPFLVSFGIRRFICGFVRISMLLITQVILGILFFLRRPCSFFA
jgi:hypothetical protein